MTVELETDGTLIERSARGRPDAFVEVVRRHEVAVHGFLARRAGGQVTADLLGEVWVRAFAGRDGYDPAYADARPWLFGIARNVLRAHWRSCRDAPTADRAEDPWDEVIDRLIQPDGPPRWWPRSRPCRPPNATCSSSWPGSS